MTGKSDKVKRCAIYTRKSTEHGLELEFNSLDAQRQACEAYIKSQASEGWRVLSARYDDPAYSGGNLARPALQHLLKDLQAGAIDIVVVYKIDRLTRSLTDFAKLVEIFEAKEVSFVAITQQFNTTTSMGRLTLNVLLSFAQFERELASERVRDKLAASRQKGKWTGGSVPLGYDSKGKRLVVNQAEAGTVRLIFDRYLASGSFRKLIADLDTKGVITKKRLVAGKVVGGIPFTYGPLAYLLKNRTYLGETGHNGAAFPGEHEPIIDRDTFEQVQQLIRSHSVRRSGRRHASGALFKGLLFDNRGNRMSPSFAVKDSVRYPFYVNSALLKGRKADAGSVLRVSAPALEAAVLQALRQKFEVLGESNGLTPADFVDHNVTRVVLDPKHVVITLKSAGENSSEPIEVPWSPRKTHDVAQVDEAISHRAPNPRLVQAIVRAHFWLKLLTNGTHDSIEALARSVGLHPKHIRNSLRLAFLSPAMIRSILWGGQRAALMLGDLDDAIALSWEKQQRQLGPIPKSGTARPPCAAKRLPAANA
jgi:DNA invertase Pin-like site-specific DNA recombinase